MAEEVEEVGVIEGGSRCNRRKKRVREQELTRGVEVRP